MKRLEEALVLVRRVGNSTILVAVLCQLAEVAWSQGDTGAQRAFYGEGLATLPDLTEPPGRFHMLGMLAGMARRMGDYEQAEKLLMERLAVARDQLGSAQNGWFVAWALNHLGDVARCREDPSRATALYEESLAVFRQNGERQGIAAALHNLGHVALTQGDTGRARALFTESLTVFRELGFEWSMADCLMGLAGVAGQEGYPAQAAVLYGAAETAHQAVDASGILIEPANQLAWERDMATVRSKLDEHMWARAWEAGRAMTLEQAIGYALEETGGVPAV